MSQICVILVDRENNISFIETSTRGGSSSEVAAITASKNVGREGFIYRISDYHMPSGEQVEIFMMDVRQVDETKTVEKSSYEELIKAVESNKIKDIILATAIRDLIARNVGV